MKLPSRKDCQEIVKNNDKFYCNTHIINDHEVEVYTYFGTLPYTLFKELDAFELRGLVFVNDTKELSFIQKVKKFLGLEYKEWRRVLCMRKFFNLGEHEDFSLEKLRDVRIKRVDVKEDGSIINFVKIGDKWFPKSKTSFKSEQVDLVKEIIGNDYLYDHEYHHLICKITNHFDTLKSAIYDYTYLFELVSPRNQIVVDYPKTELKLIQMRCNQTGNIMFDYGAYIGPRLRELVNSCKGIEGNENKEGFVVHFENGVTVKLKNDWYMSLHGLVGDTIQENNLINIFLKGVQDDLYAKITGEKLQYIKNFEKKFDNMVNVLSNEFIELRNKFIDEYKKDRKAFALDYKRNRMFSYITKYFTKDLNQEELKLAANKHALELIEWECYRLHEARRFMKTFEENSDDQ